MTNQINYKTNQRTTKTLLTTIILAFALLLSGCGDTGSDIKNSGLFGDGSSTSSTSSGDGVTIDLENLNFEPQKGNEFSIILNLKNYLLHDVNVQVKPTGFDWNYLKSGLQKEFSLKLSKATAENPNQNAHYIEGIKLDGFTGNYIWNPTFKYCYTAKSTFREQICIPNKLNNCDATVSSSKFENGPLSSKITSIYPISDSEIGVEIDVSNSNSGVVVNDCFQDENKNQFGNKINTPVVKLGTQTGSCAATSSSNGFSLNQNKLSMKCKFKRSGDGSESYASQITVDYDYKYQQSTKSKITIVDLEQNN